MEDQAMSRIVAGRFKEPAGAEAVLKALPEQGFQRSEFEMFFVTPPGQHATFPIGGDVFSDEGARKGGGGAVIGAAIGAGAGLLVGIIAYMAIEYLDVAVLWPGFIGRQEGESGAGLGLLTVALVAVGAYVGSLIGAMSKMRSGSVRRATVEHPVERPSGLMVAIKVDRQGSEPRAIETLQRYGARDIERTEGKWEEGDWKDFDPRIPTPPDAGVPGESVVSKITAEGQRDR
jgi:hypothetical protein